MIHGDTRSLLAVEDLQVSFRSRNTIARAVDGVSLTIRRGGTLGLVGESGCGKSVTALSTLRLIPDPPGRIENGRIFFEGRGDLLALSDREMRDVRGNEISMIFQEPMTSLNPVFTCGYQIDEAIMLHQRVARGEARRRTIEILRRVGIPVPEQRVDEYPHRLSGGMRQRVMIAMALSCHPSLLIADEPTTALDVTIQAQILDLLKHLQEEFHMAILLITHDFGVIAETADSVAVMYAGKIVEHTAVEQIFCDPRHPYTRGLLASIPRIGVTQQRLSAIPGTVPDAAHLPSGCRFHPRCPMLEEQCRQEEPPLLQLEPGHRVACWKA